MNRFLKVAYLVFFFTALALPSLHFLGAKETWRKIYGAERIPDLPALTFRGFVDRSYQSMLTEHFSKAFFLRNTFYTTQRQINEAANFGLFHPAGYKGNKTIEGKAFDARGVGVIFEGPYLNYHLRCKRDLKPEGFDRTVALLKDFDEFCRMNGMDFVFQSVPDKPQTYPDYLPEWVKWSWNYENYPIQTLVAETFNARGVKTIDGLAYFNDLRKETKTWLYPPGGTHFTCLASARLAEEIVRRVNAAGRIRLDVNPLTDVVDKPDAIWSVDNDISLLLNTWKNPHVDTNCHYFPVFKHEHKVMNEGSVFILGDCYRDQMEKIFADSGLFAKDKILKSKRKGQKPEDFKNVIGDLKLVVLTFQSFNSALLNDGETHRRSPDYNLYEELKSIFTALREAKFQLVRK